MKIIFSMLIFFPSLLMASSKGLVLKWGIAHDLYYHQVVAKEFKNYIEQATDKRIQIDIEIFSSNSGLKSAKELLESGKYQITQDIIGNFGQMVPQILVWEVPFLFKNFDHAEKYIKSRNAELVLQQIANAEKNLLPVAYSYSGGPLLIYSRKKIDSFRELAGQTVSTSEEFGFNEKYLKQLNISGVLENARKEIPVGEELAAALDKIYSEYDNPLNLWINVTNHRFISRLIFVSKKSADKMSPEDKKLFLAKMKELMVKERELSRQSADLTLKLLKNRGTPVNIWSAKQKEENYKLFSASAETDSAVINEIKFITDL